MLFSTLKNRIDIWFASEHSSGYQPLAGDEDIRRGKTIFDDDSVDLFGNVKQEDLCKEVLTLLSEKKIVSICGARGVGKSNLLSKIESEALASKKFDYVFRISCPENGCIEEKIIADFANSKGLRLIDRQKRHKLLIDSVIYNTFLLLIDDLQKPIQFIQDIVNPPKKSNMFYGRVVFTTRSLNLPKKMSCPSLHVAPLSHQESWELLAGDDNNAALNMVSNPVGTKLVEKMVEECHGLPLALKVLAGAVKGVETKQLEVLRWRAYDLSNPIKLFQFAMDCLPSDAVRKCFFYPALFPKDELILEDELIQLWIAEDLVPCAGACDISRDIKVKLGHNVLEILKSANLLESRLPKSSRGKDKLLQMNNTFREIVLSRSPEILVESGFGLEKAPIVNKWKQIKRISLMSNEIQEFNEIPRSNSLETMLLNYNNYSKDLSSNSMFPENFFAFLPFMRVLDLSHTKFQKLPHSIGEMISLEYLNLSDTLLRSLPEEMGKLKKLKWLNLRNSYQLRFVPEGLLSNFVELQFFDIFHSSFEITERNSENTFHYMEQMNDLGILGISTTNVTFLQKFSNNNTLPKTVVSVEVSNSNQIEEISFSGIFGFMENLKEVCLSNLSSLRNIIFDHDSPTPQYFQNLETLEINYCKVCSNISWGQCLPKLEELVIMNNNVIEQLFSDGCEHCFPKLKYLNLNNLTVLRDIGDYAVFPSLENLIIYECPKLKTLPMGIHNSKLKNIYGSNEWWGSCSMDEHTRLSLSPYFRGHVKESDKSAL